MFMTFQQAHHPEHGALMYLHDLPAAPCIQYDGSLLLCKISDRLEIPIIMQWLPQLGQMDEVGKKLI